MVSRRASASKRPDAAPEPRLAHIMLVGGTSEEWNAFDDAAWSARVDRMASVASAVGARWVTIRPIGRGGGAEPANIDVRTFRSTSAGSSADGPSDAAGTGDVTVIVDPEPDARAHFARALAALAADGVTPDEITEDRLAHMLCRAPMEPDLAVILGPSDRLPTSVSWELAYAEMVYLDVAWDELEVRHIESAVQQFEHRDRRFGGVEP